MRYFESSFAPQKSLVVSVVSANCYIQTAIYTTRSEMSSQNIEQIAETHFFSPALVLRVV
jgi:hypothetical protein